MPLYDVTSICTLALAHYYMMTKSASRVFLEPVYGADSVTNISHHPNFYCLISHSTSNG